MFKRPTIEQYPVFTALLINNIKKQILTIKINKEKQIPGSGAAAPFRLGRFIFKPVAQQPIRAGLKGQGLEVRDALPAVVWQVSGPLVSEWGADVRSDS